MKTRAVEDIYELTPMQRGMLYHTLESPGSGMYCIQVPYRLRGPLDPDAFARAWQCLIDRHSSLRTSFHWRDLERPVQVVHRRACAGFQVEAWEGRGAREREERLEVEREREFDLERPPLMRLLLLRHGPGLHELVLTHHHLILDGWCKRIMFSEVFSIYRCLLAGDAPALPPPPCYRAYVDWLKSRDLDATEAFWRGELAGFDEPTPLPGKPPAEPPGPEEPLQAERHAELSATASGALRAVARARRVTLNTLLQGLWAILLGQRCARDDVLFGATVSGRPAELDGADSTLGLFINTLPVRVRLAAQADLFDWLQDLQVRQARARVHEHTALATIQGWSAVAGGRALFDSILVFENNAGYGAAQEQYGSLTVESLRPLSRNSLPLTLLCVPAAALALQLSYDRRQLGEASAEAIIGDLVALLELAASNSELSLADCRAAVGALGAAREQAAAREARGAARGRLQRFARRRATVPAADA